MVFTVLGEIVFLNGSFPGGLSLLGMIIIMLGMVANSILNRSVPVVKQKKNSIKKEYGSITKNHTLFFIVPLFRLIRIVFHWLFILKPML